MCYKYIFFKRDKDVIQLYLLDTSIMPPTRRFGGLSRETLVMGDFDWQALGAECW